MWKRPQHGSLFLSEDSGEDCELHESPATLHTGLGPPRDFKWRTTII